MSNIIGPITFEDWKLMRFLRVYRESKTDYYGSFYKEFLTKYVRDCK